MPTALVAMGGNLGDVPRTVDRVVESLTLQSGIRNVQRSPLYRTEPVGDRAGEAFINGALALETNLAPLELLHRLQALESELGRIRTIHWGPRVIDLDLIAWGDSVVDLPELQVPHPLMWCRRFVLDPLTDIDPHWKHPILGLSVAGLRERLLQRPLPVQLFGYACQTAREVEVVFGPEVLVDLLPDSTEGEGRLGIGHPSRGAFHVEVPNESPESMNSYVVAMIRGALDSPQPCQAARTDGAHAPAEGGAGR